MRVKNSRRAQRVIAHKTDRTEEVFPLTKEIDGNINQQVQIALRNADWKLWRQVIGVERGKKEDKETGKTRVKIQLIAEQIVPIEYSETSS
jgi:hypothetical protein